MTDQMAETRWIPLEIARSLQKLSDAEVAALVSWVGSEVERYAQAGADSMVRYLRDKAAPSPRPVGFRMPDVSSDVR